MDVGTVYLPLSDDMADRIDRFLQSEPGYDPETPYILPGQRAQGAMRLIEFALKEKGFS